MLGRHKEVRVPLLCSNGYIKIMGNIRFSRMNLKNRLSGLLYGKMGHLGKLRGNVSP